MRKSLTLTSTPPTGETAKKLLLLAGTALLWLATVEPAAHAQRVNFTYTASVVTYRVPTTGLYQILAFGAQGGSDPSTGAGGRGAEIGGNFSLTAGDVLQIAVGGSGAPNTLAGGGGSFVVGPGNTPLVIAGGGAGAGFSLFGPSDGQGGLTGPNGGGTIANGIFTGGTDGNGGAGENAGGGGGGFFTSGGNSVFGGSYAGGGAFPDLAGGSPGGGFGGGGGGEGGGGGYSGGGGGTASVSHVSGAGGGGSFDAGTDQIVVADLQTGSGEVVIMEISPKFAGTPGNANCHGQSVSALAKQYGGLNGAAAALGFASVDALQAAIQEFCVG